MAGRAAVGCSHSRSQGTYPRSIENRRRIAYGYSRGSPVPRSEPALSCLFRAQMHPRSDDDYASPGDHGRTDRLLSYGQLG
jgi:hypothetical protein